MPGAVKRDLFSIWLLKFFLQLVTSRTLQMDPIYDGSICGDECVEVDEGRNEAYLVPWG